MYYPPLKAPVIRKETPFSSREFDVSKVITSNADRITRYCKNVLSKKFCIPVEIEDETARVIAHAYMTGGYGDIWLNEKSVSQKDLRLRLVLEYQPDNTIS